MATPAASSGVYGVHGCSAPVPLPPPVIVPASHSVLEEVRLRRLFMIVFTASEPDSHTQSSR